MNIKDYLKRNNLSIAALSRMTGYNDSTIHHWIAGTRKISKSAIMHLELLELYNTEHDVFPIQKKRLK